MKILPLYILYSYVYTKKEYNMYILPFTNGLYSRYLKSEIPKKRRVFIISGFLFFVFFLYLMQMSNRIVDFPLARNYWAFTDIPPKIKP